MDPEAGSEPVFPGDLAGWPTRPAAICGTKGVEFPSYREPEKHGYPCGGKNIAYYPNYLFYLF